MGREEGVRTGKSVQAGPRRAAVTAACLASLLLVCAVDWLTPASIPFGPYYLIPVALAAWYLGELPCAVLVGIATIARTSVLAKHLAAPGYSVYAVDMVTTLLAYGATAFALLKLRRSQRQLAAAAHALRSQAREAERCLAMQWSIRRAVPSDVDAIVALVVSGAETGDLGKESLDPARQQVLRSTYLASIERGAGSRRTWFAREAVVPIDFWVSHVDGRLAGYFMVMGLDDKGGSERELHAIVTAPAFRGRGLGAAMVDFFCAHYHGRRQFAACMPDGRMHRMLAARAFRKVSDTEEGYVVVERPEWLPHGASEPRPKLGFMPISDSVLEPVAGSSFGPLSAH